LDLVSGWLLVQYTYLYNIYTTFRAGWLTHSLTLLKGFRFDVPGIKLQLCWSDC